MLLLVTGAIQGQARESRSIDKTKLKRKSDVSANTRPKGSEKIHIPTAEDSCCRGACTVTNTAHHYR